MIPDGFVPVAISECEVAGYRIPKGSELLVNVCGIARDPALWPDPLVFRPALFLPGGSHAYVDVKGGDFGLIPFGAGRRICAGLSWGLRMSRKRHPGACVPLGAAGGPNCGQVEHGRGLHSAAAAGRAVDGSSSPEAAAVCIRNCTK